MKHRQTLLWTPLLALLVACGRQGGPTLGSAPGAGAPGYITVMNTADSGAGSLRQAITDANARPGQDIINFQGTVRGTVVLQSELPVVTDLLTIAGPGRPVLTIDGNNVGRVLQVDGTTLALSRLTITGGNAGDGEGGGIIVFNGGTLSLSGSTLSGNSATDGGGIFNLSDQGKLTILNSTLSGNSATRDGGGLFNQIGAVAVVNSTLSGNGAVFGGAISNMTEGGGLTLTNSTLSGNGIDSFFSVTLRNTVIASSPSIKNCDVGSEEVMDSGGNLSSDGSCAFTAPTSRNGVDPRLGPLQDNAGETFTHALLSGSPAIDAAVAPCPETDQRGFYRIGACDSGAFEADFGTLDAAVGRASWGQPARPPESQGR